MVLVRILMSKSGFKDEVLIKLLDSWGCEACHHTIIIYCTLYYYDYSLFYIIKINRHSSFSYSSYVFIIVLFLLKLKYYYYYCCNYSNSSTNTISTPII
jgi:hypothetical protein